MANTLAQELINPENLATSMKGSYEDYFDWDVAGRFPFGIQIMAVYFLVVGMIGSLLTFNYSRSQPKKDLEIEVARGIFGARPL